MNPDTPVNPNDPRWLISALADGEVDGGDVGRGCAAWAEPGSQARHSWHAYHLIGDVLRSDDLASPPGRDQAFLEQLRVRLSQEPAVLAPQPLRASGQLAAVAAARRVPWFGAAALAAGVMALATGLVLTLSPADGPGAAVPLAQAPSLAVVAGNQAAMPPLSHALSAGPRILRDAQLDRYLQAHRDYGTALPGSLPGGAGRSIATVSYER